VATSNINNELKGSACQDQANANTKRIKKLKKSFFKGFEINFIFTRFYLLKPGARLTKILKATS